VKILIAGGLGQVGRAVTRVGRARGHQVAAPGHAALDLCDPDAIARALDELGPALVVNAAAYTDVDGAEREPDRAHAINAGGAGALAERCAARGVPLLHLSTDHVFDGAATAPYREDDPRAPRSVYGASKAAGEDRVAAAGGIVVRTSWVFSARGPGFVQTIVRLAAERAVLRVVADQHGCPTFADDLAAALLALGERAANGAALAPRYHYCNDGVTTRHGFATAIVALARRDRAIACERIDAIATDAYPTAARRPAHAVLDTGRIRAAGLVPPPWTIGLARALAPEPGA
jgi:dTDP-4-dehydrorhamnose reductase